MLKNKVPLNVVDAYLQELKQQDIDVVRSVASASIKRSRDMGEDAAALAWVEGVLTVLALRGLLAPISLNRVYESLNCGPKKPKGGA